MGFFSDLFGGPTIDPTPILTLAAFREQVIGAEVPVIVDVWSPTCAPCKALVPVMRELATKHDGRVRVAEINVAAAEPALLGKLGVRATPTVIIYEGGEEFGRVTGYRPPSWFHEMIAVEFPEAAPADG